MSHVAKARRAGGMSGLMQSYGPDKEMPQLGNGQRNSEAESGA